MTAFFVEFWGKSPRISRSGREPWLSRLSFRNPDASGIWEDEALSMSSGVHRFRTRHRLEQQPWNDTTRNTVAAFDGCLVDRADLVRRIRAAELDASFAMPDVELVSLAYAAYGLDLAANLNGEFSLAIYDARCKRVLLARDVFGRRALFYAQTRDGWAASNELPALRVHPDCSSEKSRPALADFLLFGHHDFHDKALTPYRDIQAVPPGGQVVLDASGAVRTAYWRFPEIDVVAPTRNGEYVERLQDALFAAVRERMDCARVLVSMSGGLDSTAIAAVAKRVVDSDGQDQRVTLETHVLNYGEDEEKFARLAAERLALPHRIRQHSFADLLSPWPPTWAPHRQVAPGAILQHDQEVARNADIRFVGDAADSALAHDICNFRQLVHSFGLRTALAARSEYSRRFGASMSWGSGLGRRRWFRREDVAQPAPPILDFPKWLNPDLVRNLDLHERWRDFWSWTPVVSRTQPHPSIERWLGWPNWFCGNGFVNFPGCPAEIMDPFFDMRVVMAGLSCPPDPWLREKHVLREAVRPLLPEAVVNRRKVIAGDVFKDPIASANIKDLDQWAPTDELDEYVVRSAIPAIDLSADPARRLASLHPLFLNNWLRATASW